MADVLQRFQHGSEKRHTAIPAEIPRMTRMLFAVPRYEADASPIVQRFHGFFLGRLRLSNVMDPQKTVSAQTG